MPSSFKIIYDPAHWDAVIAKLDGADEIAKGEFKQALDEAAAPIIADVRAQALAGPSHGSKHTGLRSRLAGGVTASPDSSGTAAIKIEAHDGLSRPTDNGPAGWRHPVYGNKNNWVHQDGWSWFKEPVQHHSGEVEDRLNAALQQLADRIG